ncbi:phage scaffolding protein [Companilactobacillus hulinensis]|uniref:phage scaffolding protein n=1 Tax=Companilactobacillus hulinensis TaxID=2486007 RepID=UPI000F77005F|nr:phage scaffolding protein [Companilactobacillus hulinensis]
MKRDFLKDLGLADDSIDKIMSEYGRDIQGVNSKLASAEEQRDSFKSQIDDRDSQIKELGSKVGNSDGMKEQIESLKSTISDNDKKAASDLLQVRQDNAVQNYLKDAGVRDAKAVMPFIDTDTVKFDADKSELTGLQEQVDNIKADHDYLFQPDDKSQNKPAINAISGGNPSGAPAPDDEFAKALGLHNIKED